MKLSQIINQRLVRFLFILAILVFYHNSLYAQIEARDIVNRSLAAFYYPANDTRIKINMKLINSQGKTRNRDMIMLRKNVSDGGDQKYYIYFKSPRDIKGTTFMVYKYLEKEDDRWIYIPAIKLVKRIASDDKRSSFIGSDFSYEDISGRNVDDETHLLIRQETFNGRPVFVIESKPKSTISNYQKRISWIDEERWLPLKEQYIDARGEVVREFTADKVEEIDSYWSVTARTMKNLQTDHRTEVTWQQVKYNVNIKSKLFSERYLRNPPLRWIK